jgi:hypothetical protein
VARIGQVKCTRRHLTRKLVAESFEEYFSEVRRIAGARRLLRQSFGLWKSRDDLRGDSVDIVNKLREEWDERTKRLGIE